MGRRPRASLERKNMMTELKPEERQRIYEEEKARIEAQAQNVGEVTAKPKKKSLGCGTFALILGGLVVLAVVLYQVMIWGPSSTRTFRPAPKSDPIVTTAPLTVKANKFSVNEYGGYEVVGEVTNISSKTFRFVEVKAEFLNAAAVVVGTDTAYACGMDYILPNGKKSFKMMGEKQPDYKSVRVSIDDYSEVR
jgi:hypothetical protein